MTNNKSNKDELFNCQIFDMIFAIVKSVQEIYVLVEDIYTQSKTHLKIGSNFTMISISHSGLKRKLPHIAIGQKNNYANR